MQLYKTAGAEVTPQTVTAISGGVRFPPGMLREILKTAPAEFTQHARNPANNVQIGGNNVVFAPSYGSPFVMDLDRGRRYGTIEDFQNFIKLAQSSPWLHHSGGTVCEPTDVPVNKRHLDMVYSPYPLFRPGLPWLDHRAGTCRRQRRNGAHPVREAFTDQNCVVMGNFNTTSPLGDRRRYGRGHPDLCRRQPGVDPPALPSGGRGGPADHRRDGRAGTGGIDGVLRAGPADPPRAPTILASFFSSMSLKTGSPTFGMPEPAIGSLVMGQLARRLNMPLRCAGTSAPRSCRTGRRCSKA
jgi:trimethylamine--corrinoid protein Co-methyltransferase